MTHTGLNRNVTCPSCGSIHARLDAICVTAPYAGKRHTVLADFSTDERPYHHTYRSDAEAQRGDCAGVVVQCVCGRCEKLFCIVISATQEELGAHDDLANLAATLRLTTQLDALDLPFVPCGGVYRGVAQGTSFLVIGDEAVGRYLCRGYRQESILTPDGLIDADGNLIARRVGDRFDEEALSSDFYSVFRNGLFWSADLEFAA